MKHINKKKEKEPQLTNRQNNLPNVCINNNHSTQKKNGLSRNCQTKNIAKHKLITHETHLIVEDADIGL